MSVDYLPLVSVITVNFNSSRVTSELIESLRRCHYPQFEIIVVDNGSKEEADWLKIEYPEIIFIRSEENLGFAGGNNLGIAKASGDFLLFLNNDTEVEARFMEPLLDVFADEKIGMASPMIKYFNTNLIQYAGNEKINIFTGRSKRRGFKEEDKGQFKNNTVTESVHGAAMIVPRSVVNEIGGIPEYYFLYYEEIDWSEMAKNAGYKIMFVPKAVIFHKESVSIGKLSSFKTYYLNRSRILYMRRNTTGFARFVWILFYTFLTIPKNSLLYLLKFEFKHLSAFWRAIGWNLTHKTPRDQ